MLKTVRVTNHLDESLLLTMGSSVGSGLLITNIEGLGPVEATVNVSDYVTMDGGFYNSAHVSSRNIVLTLGMTFCPTIEDSRLVTYRYFPVKKPVKLTFETDNRLVDIVGYVESNEPTIFSKEQQTQISIICPDPYFYETGSGQCVTFFGIEPKFSFPFKNDSTSENQLYMSEMATESSGVIYYTGDLNVGVTMTLCILGLATNITISNAHTGQNMFIDTTKIGSALKSGDAIVISTKKGAKHVRLLRDGQYMNILNAMDQTSDWIQLTKGDNLIYCTAESGEDNIEFKMEYRTAYEGV